MRIISGKLKGKSINFIKNSVTRPLKDSVKENIFNVLCHSNLIKTKIEKANILDLYSGVGSFGLECISRGAKKVKFIEQNKQALGTLKENLMQLSIINRAELINDHIENVLLKNNKEKYDIFFFDPPFSDETFLNNLDLIKKKKIYKNKHIIIIHRKKNSSDELNDLMDILITKQYGRSKIIFGIFS
jgi:16S rRNA (guanine966-N2)-methyltransferase